MMGRHTTELEGSAGNLEGFAGSPGRTGKPWGASKQSMGTKEPRVQCNAMQCNVMQCATELLAAHDLMP